MGGNIEIIIPIYLPAVLYSILFKLKKGRVDSDASGCPGYRNLKISFKLRTAREKKNIYAYLFMT